MRAEIIFTEVGDPNNQIQQLFDEVFQSEPGPWSRSAPDDVMHPNFPNGNFRPGRDPTNGGIVPVVEVSPLAIHVVIPPRRDMVPEPATLALLGVAPASPGMNTGPHHHIEATVTIGETRKRRSMNRRTV